MWVQGIKILNIKYTVNEKQIYTNLKKEEITTGNM